MTTELNQYRVWCNVDLNYVYVWANVEPVVCPDNNAHAIDTNSTTIIETLNPEKNIKLDSKINNINNSKFNRVGLLEVPDIQYGVVKAIIWMDSSNTSYTVRFFDKINNVLILETTLTNTTDTVQNLGNITNLSSTEIEIFVKKTGGNSNSKVYFENFVIYYS